MPLPQQVVEQLGKDSVNVPGWSPGILFFSGSIFALIVVIYAGLTFGYQPYLNGNISQINGQINTLAQSISSADRAKLFTYDSQVANLNTVMSSHVLLDRKSTRL